MSYVIAVLISLAIAVPTAILWANAIDRQMNDPEWQEHKDDQDYWDWP